MLKLEGSVRSTESSQAHGEKIGETCISQVHDEILVHIFSLLDANSQRSASLVSKQWNQLASFSQVLNRPGHAKATHNCASFMKTHFHQQLTNENNGFLQTIINTDISDAKTMNTTREHLLNIMKTIDAGNLRKVPDSSQYK